MFDIEELREVTAYDELELDTLGDRKTALFLIMSDTDDSFNFLISMCYTQLFNLLCEKADDVYGGRLPVHYTADANPKYTFNIEKFLSTKLRLKMEEMFEVYEIDVDDAEEMADGG